MWSRHCARRGDGCRAKELERLPELMQLGPKSGQVVGGYDVESLDAQLPLDQGDDPLMLPRKPLLPLMDAFHRPLVLLACLMQCPRHLALLGELRLHCSGPRRNVRSQMLEDRRPDSQIAELAALDFGDRRRHLDSPRRRPANLLDLAEQRFRAHYRRMQTAQVLLPFLRRGAFAVSTGILAAGNGFAGLRLRGGLHYLVQIEGLQRLLCRRPATGTTCICSARRPHAKQ
mmetsp:Transcript_111684/g.320887  ORF Transcript_111684/g.320887 Transcript_111684/m.320887 type:complete len:230 (-) Transcript_111684:1074-1763(-)